MLEIQGRGVRLCDGLTRRSFLKLGSLGLAGLTLPNFLQAGDHRRQGARAKAVILYWMAGGPSHIDTYDMKPDAASQVRGPFRPAATSVPGMRFCELMPRQARLADRISVVRSLTHSNFDHFSAAHWVQTGNHVIRVMGKGQPFPSQGSVVSMMRGPNHPGMPPYVITSPRVQAAFDVSREPMALQERYGRHAWGQSALLARRLVEAGVTFVTINHFEAEVDWWDDHNDIEVKLRRRLPIYDQAIGSLIEDLHERGMGDEVLVAAFGEFGRSPVIDSLAGRGHWARAWHALLSGGGVQGGRLYGSTTANGGEPASDAVGPANLLATIYHALGMDPDVTVNDRQNRPVRLLDGARPICELF